LRSGRKKNYLRAAKGSRINGSDLKMDSKMGRRDFLGTVALAGAVAATARSSFVVSAQAATAAGGDITLKSASELALAIRSKQLSSKAIVEAHLARIAEVNPKLNAIVQLTADTARKEADEADAAWRGVISRGRCMACP
jgi:amidase